jgi:DNA polymerase IV
MDSTLKEKIAFFDELEALDRASDDDNIVNDKERRHREVCRAFFSSREKKPPGNQRHTTPMAGPLAPAPNPGTRAEANPGVVNPASKMTAGTDASAPPKPAEAAPVPGTILSRPSSLRRSATLPTTPSSTLEQPASSGPGTRKRKRQLATKTIPESAKVFRGLAFYYIPNNDIAPARKLRIARAQEYGALWVRNLSEATHVIVDKNLVYKDIQDIVVPDVAGLLTIVNEDYPLDCIQFKNLLNPDQARYKVVGHPSSKEKAVPGEAPQSSQTSDRSLRIKPSRTSRRSSSGTPPRDVQSSPGPMDQTSRELEESEIAAPVPTFHQQDESTNKSPPPQKDDIKDELSEYIQFVQQFKGLPLDPEDDEATQSSKGAHGSDSEEVDDGRSDDERTRKRVAGARKDRKELTFEDRFACNHGGTKDKSADAANPNARTIEVLEQMCNYYDRINDHWRTTAYRKAITTLRRQTVKITTAEEAYRLPNIGQRLAAKIEEIATTNKLQRLDYAQEEPLDHVLQTFLNIYGVGLGRANKWIAQGFRTLDDLRQRANLTPNQRIGIDHYDDLNSRIPRAEVTALFGYVRREAARLDPAVELLVGGSYRRGADSSGDMDVIVTKKGTTSATDLVPFLEQLVEVLMRKGFLVATLAGLNHRRNTLHGEPSSKWHGCCVLPPDATDLLPADSSIKPAGIWRRIDFLLVPETEYGAALIYFTGNDIFNRSLRLLAAKKGMHLNQRGLYLRRSDRRAAKAARTGSCKMEGTVVQEGELLEGRDEKRIFEILGVKWREPWERWC